MFFISSKKSKFTLVTSYKCAICGEKTTTRFIPMREWNIEGVLCGDCYSKQLHDYYPGEHIRVNKDLD